MKQNNKVLGINEKLAAGGCALSAIYLLPASALATPVINNTSITFNLGDSPVYWDVDGNGVDEFVLNGGSYAGFLDSDDYAGIGALGARGMVQEPPNDYSDLFSPLAPGFAVGSSLATGYVWGSSPQGARTIVNYSTYSGGQVGGDADRSGFVPGGDQYFGFRFDRAGQTHYAWAEINIDISAPGGFTIVRWGYEDQPDTPIFVDAAAPAPGEATAIPVNSLPFIGLTLLGLGAAGVRELRRKRKVDSELH